MARRPIVRPFRSARSRHATRGDFNERTVKSPAYGIDEVRFTVKGDWLYIFVLNPAADTTIRLNALGLGSKYHPRKITATRMIGGDEPVHFTQDRNTLSLTVPAKRPDALPAVFEVTGAL